MYKDFEKGYYKDCHTYKQKRQREREIIQMDKHFRCMDCQENEARKSQWSEHMNNWCRLCNRMCVEIEIGKCPKEGVNNA